MKYCKNNIMHSSVKGTKDLDFCSCLILLQGCIFLENSSFNIVISLLGSNNIAEGYLLKTNEQY